MSLNLMAPGPAGPTTLAAIPGSANSESFISRVIADRIVFVSCHRRISLQPSTSYGTTHLWSRFYELTNRHLQKINHDITQTTGDRLDYLLKRRVFERICDLTEAEVCEPRRVKHETSLVDWLYYPACLVSTWLACPHEWILCLVKNVWHTKKPPIN